MSENNGNNKQITLYDKTQALFKNEKTISSFGELLGGSQMANAFAKSVLLVCNESNKLQECDPLSILGSAYRAATLRLSVDPSTGHAYIVPYGKKATFIIGYRGLIQLAHRTSNYRDINATLIYEGEEVKENRITGRHTIHGSKQSDTVIGYLAYFELRSGMKKTWYMDRDAVEKWGIRYSKSWGFKDSPWTTHFDAMGLKTVLRRLFLTYGDFNTPDALALERAIKAKDEDEIIDTSWVDRAIEDQLRIEEENQTVKDKQTPEEIMAALGIDVETGEITGTPAKKEQLATPAELRGKIKNLSAYLSKRPNDEKALNNLNNAQLELEKIESQADGRIR